MKSRFFKTTLLAIVIVGGIWVLLNRKNIREPGDLIKLIGSGLSSINSGIQYPDESKSEPATRLSSYPIIQNSGQPRFVTNVIRIASFGLNPDATRPGCYETIEIVADICRRYDVIALQNVDASDDTWLEQLTKQLNTVGSFGSTTAKHPNESSQSTADYRFMTQPPEASTRGIRSVIVFNHRTVESSSSQQYTIHDPDDILSRDPQVALFRARGPVPNNAFTFTLVNLQLDSNQADRERAYVSTLFRAVRNDGRGEDDVLMVGDFQSDDAELRLLQYQAGLMWAITDEPTDIAHRTQTDNIVFSESSTVEFTGRAKTFDFMRHYNLRMDDAIRISTKMPIWAEFSIFEGSGPTTLPPNRTAQESEPASR